MSEPCKRCAAGVERVIAAMHPSGTGYMEGCAIPYEVPRWIPVFERLPDDGQYVLVIENYRKKQYVTPACYVRGAFVEFVVFDDGDNATYCHKVSAWQPLPEPPKE